MTPTPVSSTTTPDPVTAERNVNPRFWMDERTVDTLSQKLTVPLQLQLDSVSDGLKEEYRNLLGSLRDDLYSLKMETAGFHGTLDQRLVNALRTLFNEVPDESINNTTHAINPGRHLASIKYSCQLDYFRHLVLTNLFSKN